MAFSNLAAQIECFNPGVNPGFRETYVIGNGNVSPNGYFIYDSLIGCGKCLQNRPQKCIIPGRAYHIEQTHCLHCGNRKVCHADAAEKRG